MVGLGGVVVVVVFGECAQAGLAVVEVVGFVEVGVVVVEVV